MLLLMIYEPLFEQRIIMNMIDRITLVMIPPPLPPSVNNGPGKRLQRKERGEKREMI